MPTATVENYVKAIYVLCRESSEGEAGVARLAAMLGVTKGTTTAMVKKLGESGLAKAERYGGVRLTPKGTRMALDILRRHRLIETFLVRTLRLDWSVVHAEAERLEHAISPVVLEALDAFLGHPNTDPHGDPIPDREGRTFEPGGQPLSAFIASARVRVLRIIDQDAAFLRFAAAHGLRPGAVVTVVAVDQAARAITARAEGHDAATMALEAAQGIVCEPT